MKKSLLILTALLFLATPALADDAVHGTWRTQPDDNGNYGLIQIADCGAKLCGTLMQSFGSNGQPIASTNIGRSIVWDMEPGRNGRYNNGRVYAPDRDSTYNSHMQLTGNSLAVSGCFLFICRDVIWTRQSS
jgi:uncharacterized protein (DUF2147 family)